MVIQQKQAANIDQSPLHEMSIQDMEDLKQHYLDEMLSLSNDLQIKDYRNEKIDIHFRRECKDMIDELKGKFNGMSIEINKKIELQRLEQESTFPLNEIISQEPPSNAITPVLLTMEPDDSLIMEDEMSVVSILEGFTDEPFLEENDDLFDLESKKNEWKKILYDDPIDDLIFNPGGDINEIDAFLDIDVSMNIKDGYHDSEGDILYLESLPNDDTTPNPPPEVFLDRDPRSDFLNFEDSRACGFDYR
uniref:Reverse transcriptase domain-containing protein n=1 Tax=Tanacetum cinerariifolium TaxID=118510 RepID=A0A6L2NU03_TANCI|nr:hypothetical protein [Tanacetum cinerariifolium]